MPSIRRPGPVRALVALAWLRIGIGILIITLGFAFLSTPDHEVLRGVRNGFLGATGYASDTYGPTEAGEILGSTVIPLLLSVLLLVFVNRRKLTPLRITAGIIVLASLSQPASLLFTIPILVLTLLRSTKAYCREGTQAIGAAGAA